MKHCTLILLLGLAACTSPRDRMKMETEALLRKANQSLLSEKPESAQVDSACKSIDAFVQKFPADTLSPGFLFEKALLQEKQRQYPACLASLEKIYAEYPSSRQASKSVFLQGFLYANVLNQLDMAREKYQLYLDKYSSVDPKMTGDVKMELENLGKTPDQILEEIEKRGRMDTVQAPS